MRCCVCCAQVQARYLLSVVGLAACGLDTGQPAGTSYAVTFWYFSAQGLNATCVPPLYNLSMHCLFFTAVSRYTLAYAWAATMISKVSRSCTSTPSVPRTAVREAELRGVPAHVCLCRVTRVIVVGDPTCPSGQTLCASYVPGAPNFCSWVSPVACVSPGSYKLL